MKMNPDTNQHIIWLGSALILCILTYGVLSYLGKPDTAMTQLALILGGAIAGNSVPRGTGSTGTVITSPQDSTINTNTPAPTDAGTAKETNQNVT